MDQDPLPGLLGQSAGQRIAVRYASVALPEKLYQVIDMYGMLF
jgi:hypothetical protein